MRSIYLILIAFASLVVACSSQQGGGASPSPSPSWSGTPLVFALGGDFISAQPQNCGQKSEDFRYYDAFHHTAMPWLEGYSSYPPQGPVPDPYIRYYTKLGSPVPGVPGVPTPYAIEIIPGPVPSGTLVQIAEPVVPVIDFPLWYGLHDKSQVTIIPSDPVPLPQGQLGIASTLEWDDKYRAQQDNNALQYTEAFKQAVSTIPQGQLPTPIVTNAADAAKDAAFQNSGQTEVSAIALNGGGDDGVYKDYCMHFGGLLGGLAGLLGGLNPAKLVDPGGILGSGVSISNSNCSGLFSGHTIPVQSADPHPRIVLCMWLQARPYDAIWSIIRQTPLPPARNQTVQGNLQAQSAPSDLLNSAQYEPYERDTYVLPRVAPWALSPYLAKEIQKGDPDDEIKISRPLPNNMAPIVEHLPNPDQQ
jgi:hypothetical protein